MDARSTIAAMAAGVALGGDPATLARCADRSAWTVALAAFREAARVLDATADAEWDAVSEFYSDTAGELIKTPAPDTAALLLKLEYLFGPDAGGSASYCDEWMEAVMADAHRLLSVGRA